ALDPAPDGAALPEVLPVADQRGAGRKVFRRQRLVGPAAVVDHDQLRLVAEVLAQILGRRDCRPEAACALVVGRDDEGEVETAHQTRFGARGLSRRREGRQRARAAAWSRLAPSPRSVADAAADARPTRVRPDRPVGPAGDRRAPDSPGHGYAL